MHATSGRLVAAVLAVATVPALPVALLHAQAREPTTAMRPRPAAAQASPGAEKVAVFAGGCFWGVEGVFEHLKGVKSATSGYAGGSVPSPSYEEVSSGETGHAESVRVVYD